MKATHNLKVLSYHSLNIDLIACLLLSGSIKPSVLHMASCLYILVNKLDLSFSEFLTKTTSKLSIHLTK